jgi:1-phosphofructokinase family hexose kinase
VLVVNPNICIDHTVVMDELLPGHVQRPRAGVNTLGGKGVNVARVARRGGDVAEVVTFLPSRDEERLRRLADAEGAALVGITVEGDARGATIILEDTGRVTVLNEPGAAVDETNWRALLACIDELLVNHGTVVCSGSLPPGSPLDAYARVVTLAHERGRRCVVDSSGQVLAHALSAGADVVSPNLAEAEALLGRGHSEGVDPDGPDVVERAARAVTDLRQLGAVHVIVSAGSHGAAFDDGSDVSWCDAPQVEVVNPIGAGDSLVGGLVRALEAGEPWPRAVRIGLATASASCEEALAGGVRVRRVEELLVSMAPSRTVSGATAEVGR